MHFTRRPPAALLLVFVLVSLIASPAWSLTFTCTTVTRSKLADPNGAPFGNTFGKARLGGPMVNGSGDVVFFAKPKGAPRRLYLYPGAGASSVIAQDGDAAPGGGVFRKFESPSINDAGDVAFFGDLDIGEGVYIRQGGGTLVKVAATGDAAPGGGTIDTIGAVSRINAAGDVAFIAKITGAPNGVFRYDAGTTTIDSIAREGDTAGDGRQLCEFVAVGIGGSGAVAVHVDTKVLCSDGAEHLFGVYRQAGLVLDRVALAGDPTPIAGTTYARFYGPPDSNATDQVLFRASANGTTSGVGLFLFDPAGPTTTNLVVTGDAAPLGGTVQTIVTPGLTDGGRAAVRVRLNDDPAKHGIYLFGSPDEAVVRKSDPAPADIFIAPVTYTKILEETGVDRSGTRVTYSAKVRQGTSPHGGTGLFVCTGS